MSENGVCIVTMRPTKANDIFYEKMKETKENKESSVINWTSQAGLFLAEFRFPTFPYNQQRRPLYQYRVLAPSNFRIVINQFRFNPEV